MADWEGLRHGLEDSVSPPPLAALRERRRHRQQRRAIALTSFVVLVGSASGVAILGQAEQRREGPVASLDQVVTTEGLPPPKDYEDHVVTDIDFVSPNVGWSIGLRCVGDTCDVATWRTNDGGRTWSAPSTVANGVPRTTFHEESPSAGAVRSLRMVDEKNGYAFNPGLSVTGDGGRTWRRLPQESKATSVSIAGSTVWVAERGCPAGVDCDLVVRAGTVGSDEFRELPIPKTNGASAIVRRAGERDGYLLAWGAPRAAFHRTNDAGATWTEGTHPCADTTAASLSAGAGRPLWVVCSTPNGRRAFQSADHGTTWRPLGLPPADGVVTDLIARSANDAYLTTQQPAGLFVTSDGGRTWQRAEGSGGGFGYSNLDVVDATHAWAMGDAGFLWRTTDGRRWESRPLPPGAPRVLPSTAAAPATPTTPTRPDVEWTGLSFIDPLQGWALGRACTATSCRALLRRTDDAGETWTAAPAPLAPFANDIDRAGVKSVVFLDHQLGMVYGPELWITRNGGVDWQRVRSGLVRELVVHAGFVWTVEAERCGENDCFQAVRRAQVGTDEFATVLDGNDVPTRQTLSIAVGDSDTAYVYPGDVRDQDQQHALGTTDGGKTWRERDLPCAGALTRVATAVRDGVTTFDDELWMMCGYEGGGGNQPHRTAHSIDGGRTWTESASSDRTGYLAAFVAVSPSVAWRGDSGLAAAIKVTRNGGRTWTEAAAPEDVRGGGGPWAFHLLDATHGFALFFDDTFVRMTDGRTWQPMTTPPGS